MIDACDITGLILAGGRAERMGGVDKGLQNFHGTPLALHALKRLRPQVASVMISANRNLPAYEAFGAPVWADGLAGYAGPLAGFLTGLEHCQSRWLLTVPCDSPLFPANLASHLAAAASAQGADIALASAPEQQDDGRTRLRAQPVFCLLRTSLLPSLRRFTSEGGREIYRWTALHPRALVAFDEPGDNPMAFFNANTLEQLQALNDEKLPPCSP